jgi:ribonuclease III
VPCSPDGTGTIGQAIANDSAFPNDHYLAPLRTTSKQLCATGTKCVAVEGHILPELDSLEELLGYRFQKHDLLRRALLHPSAQGAEAVTQDDIAAAGRLSWLGDSVLEIIVSDTLYSQFPKANEKDLHKWSVQLTNNDTLGRVAQELGLKRAMVIGKSLQQNPEAKDTHVMLASALEGVLGAIYLDGGIKSARAAVQKILAEDFRKLLEQVEDLRTGNEH